MRDMLGRGQVLSVAEALALISQKLPEVDLPAINVSLSESLGRVLSRDVVSPEDLPAFSRSTVDGYAVLSGDTFGASETVPAYLKVSGEIQMGEEPAFKLGHGNAAKIATGGMLPVGADGVVMFEDVQVVDGETIEVQRAVAPFENVIQRGEDVRAGQVIAQRGRRLRPQDVALMAGVGLSEVYVYERPRVAVISTGDEVVDIGEPIKPGQVRDVNSLYLGGMILEDGGTPLSLGIIKDDYAGLMSAVSNALKEGNMVLITGGSSVGVKDLTERVIGELGEVLFHSVSMKPGKPMLAGLCSGKSVMGLPGHPRAVAVCYEVFVRPVLHKLSGVSDEPEDDLRRTVTARLARSVSSTPGRQEVISVALRAHDGELWAEPVLGKSGLLSMMVKAQGTVTVPADRSGLQKGQPVAVRLF